MAVSNEVMKLGKPHLYRYLKAVQKRLYFEASLRCWRRHTF